MPWTVPSKRSTLRIKINGHKRTGRRNIVNIASFLSPKEEVTFLRDSITMKSLEKLSIRDIIQNGKIRPVCIDTNMEELLGQAQMQNFVPVIDDRNVFIGIITRSEIIKYFIKKQIEVAEKQL